jgi:type II secretory pathway component PulC
MRLGCALAFATILIAAPVRRAAAELDLMPAYAPLKAVAVMIETGQALFWDQDRQEYRLARVGDEVYGWKIVTIEAGKVVVFQAGVRDELPLVGAPTPVVALPAARPARGRKRVPAVVVAPADPPAPAAASAASPTPAPPAARGPREERHAISRVDLNQELTDFDRLLSTVEVQPATGGGFVISRLQRNSLVWRLGLREGDVVRTVDGERISSVDDAARVYARIWTLRTIRVEVERGVERVTLLVEVRS